MGSKTVEIWTAARLSDFYDKYSVLNREYLTHPIHMILSQKQKGFLRNFFYIFQIYFKFSTYSKKRSKSYLMYFPNYGLPKRGLDKYKKSIASEYPWTSNMLNLLKLCWNMDDGMFIIFYDHCERNWGRESHS